MNYTLKTKKRIQELFKNGRKFSVNPFFIAYLPNFMEVCRYVYCTEKGSKNAVIRNKIKRILRALVREVPIPLKGLDIAIVAKPSLISLSHSERIILFSRLISKINE